MQPNSPRRGKRPTRKDRVQAIDKGGEPNWRELLGTELFKRAEFISEREGMEIGEMVVQAMQDCDKDETRALFARYGSTETILRMVVADWLAEPFDDRVFCRPGPDGAEKALPAGAERAALIKLVQYSNPSEMVHHVHLEQSVNGALALVGLLSARCVTFLNDYGLESDKRGAAGLGGIEDGIVKELIHDFDRAYDEMGRCRSREVALRALAGLEHDRAELVKLLNRANAREATPAADRPEVAS